MPGRQIIVGQCITPEKLKRAKELRTGMTPEERLVWERLRANRLYGLSIRRQQVIDGFIADFYCNDAGVVIEIDGPIHEEQVDYDSARDEILRQRGLTILRFTNEEVRSMLDDVVRKIAVACGKPDPSPQPPPRSGEGEQVEILDCVRTGAPVR
jgi:very-short-patch-repair endonuclease